MLKSVKQMNILYIVMNPLAISCYFMLFQFSFTGNATIKKSITPTQGEAIRTSETLCGLLAFDLERYRAKHRGKTTSSDLLWHPPDWAPRPWENRHSGFLSSWPCFTLGTIKQVTCGHRTRAPFLLSRHWTQLLQGLTVHWVWLILSDPLLAAFFIFTPQLTSLWDH